MSGLCSFVIFESSSYFGRFPSVENQLSCFIIIINFKLDYIINHYIYFEFRILVLCENLEKVRIFLLIDCCHGLVVNYYYFE